MIVLKCNDEIKNRLERAKRIDPNNKEINDLLVKARQTEQAKFPETPTNAPGNINFI